MSPKSRVALCNYIQYNVLLPISLWITKNAFSDCLSEIKVNFKCKNKYLLLILK